MGGNPQPACSVNGVAQSIFVYLGTGSPTSLFAAAPSESIGYDGGGLYFFAGGGDVDGDGYGDLVVSGAWGPSSFPNPGCTQSTVLACQGTLIYRGSATGLPTNPTDLLFADNIPPASTGSGTGRILAQLGDVNGDGLADFAASFADPNLPATNPADHPVIYAGAAGAISQTPQIVLSSVEVDVYAPMY
jgi:hypothetical protein